jgi:DNA-binding NtrC family response regulator
VVQLIGTGRPDVAATAGGWIMLIGGDEDDRPVIASAVRRLGLTLAVAEDFHEAKRVLAAQPPDLLITHVRLGAYNGLQLVLRGKATHPAMAAIVVSDEPDPVLERDVAEMDATLVIKGADCDAWVAAAQRAFVGHDSPAV